MSADESIVMRNSTQGIDTAMPIKILFTRIFFSLFFDLSAIHLNGTIILIKGSKTDVTPKS